MKNYSPLEYLRIVSTDRYKFQAKTSSSGSCGPATIGCRAVKTSLDRQLESENRESRRAISPGTRCKYFPSVKLERENRFAQGSRNWHCPDRNVVAIRLCSSVGASRNAQIKRKCVSNFTSKPEREREREEEARSVSKSDASDTNCFSNSSENGARVDRFECVLSLWLGDI